MPRVRQPSKRSSKPQTASTEAPSSAPTPAPAEVTPEPVAASTTSAPAPVTEPVPTPAPVPASEPTTENEPSESGETESEQKEENTVGDKLDELASQMDALLKEHKAIYSSLKKLKKEYTRELKDARKTKRKKKATRSSNKLTGFAKPSKLTPELCDFIGVPHDTELSRIEVTRNVLAYVKENDLQFPEKRRHFNVDDNLKKILGEPRFPYDKKNPDLGNGYSFFNLQRYLNGHIIKSDTPASTVPVEASA